VKPFVGRGYATGCAGETYIAPSLELLRCVFHAIIVNKIVYVIPAWYGFLNKSHILQINGIFKLAFKYGNVKSVIIARLR